LNTWAEDDDGRSVEMRRVVSAAEDLDAESPKLCRHVDAGQGLADADVRALLREDAGGCGTRDAEADDDCALAGERAHSVPPSAMKSA
jgi:hypothetical protein